MGLFIEKLFSPFVKGGLRGIFASLLSLIRRELRVRSLNKNYPI
jgi:hypothetical protein